MKVRENEVCVSVSVFESGKRREDPDTKLSYPVTQ